MDALAVIGVLALAVLVGGLCRHFDIAAPLPLVVAGLVVGLATGHTGFDVRPELALTLALPPLLFGSSRASTSTPVVWSRASTSSTCVTPATLSSSRGRTTRRVRTS